MARLLPLSLLRRCLLSSAFPAAAPPLAPLVSRFAAVRYFGDRADGNWAYTAQMSGGSGSLSAALLSERPRTEMQPLFPGTDYNHWLIIMDNPGGKGATKQQMIDCYVQTLAKVLGSEEEAKKKIYSVSFERYIGFGCEIDEETSNKLEELSGVLFALPDAYVDPEHKDYGGELFVNGEIVERPPERQKRVEPQTQKQQVRTRSVQRRKNSQ